VPEEILLVEIGVSADDAEFLKQQTGVTTVKDCTDFFIFASSTIAEIRVKVATIVLNKIVPKLEEQGYWDEYVEWVD